jgi:hypothetical protein
MLPPIFRCIPKLQVLKEESFRTKLSPFRKKWYKTCRLFRELYRGSSVIYWSSVKPLRMLKSREVRWAGCLAAIVSVRNAQKILFAVFFECRQFFVREGGGNTRTNLSFV